MGVCFCPSFKNMHLCASGIAQVTLLTLLLMVFSNGFLEVVPQDILNTCYCFTQKHIVNYLAFQPRLMDVLPSWSISSSSAPLNFNQKLPDIGELETKCLRVCEAQVLFSENEVFWAFWLTNVLRNSGVPFFTCLLNSYLRTRRFSEATFRTSGTTNHWKNTAILGVANIIWGLSAPGLKPLQHQTCPGKQESWVNPMQPMPMPGPN